MQTYIGPMVTITKTPIEVEVDVRTCPNAECFVGKHKNSVADEFKFCAQCGTEIEMLKTMDQSTRGLGDFLYSDEKYYKYEDELMQPEYCSMENCFIALENSSKEVLYIEDGDAVDLDEIDRDRLKEEFKDRHKEMLKDMEVFFGAENIDVVFGAAYYEY